MRRKRNSVSQKDKYTVGVTRFVYEERMMTSLSRCMHQTLSSCLTLQEHRPSHGSSREPLLENITSDYDLELFRKAQARASDDLVREKTHHNFALLFSPFHSLFHESVKIAGRMILRTTEFWEMQWAHNGLSSTVASTLLPFSYL